MRHDLTMTVELTAGEADAIVYAIGNTLINEAETLHNLRMSTNPGDLFRLAESSKRIGQLAEVNEQLQWRAHWRNIEEMHGLPEPVTAPMMVLLDVLAELVKRAQDQRQYGDDDVDGAFMYDEAGRRLADAFANRAAGAAAL